MVAMHALFFSAPEDNFAPDHVTLLLMGHNTITYCPPRRVDTPQATINEEFIKRSSGQLIFSSYDLPSCASHPLYTSRTIDMTSLRTEPLDDFHDSAYRPYFFLEALTPPSDSGFLDKLPPPSCRPLRPSATPSYYSDEVCF